MVAIVQHRTNTATAKQVEAHLLACNAAFIPPLESRVDIPVYAAKIAGRAQCFEAWSGDTLVGLVAAYMELGAARAFVTNVSVLPEWTGRGVASALLRRCVAHARHTLVGEVALEVDPGNAAAVGLYERIGFRPADGKGPPLAMTMQLVDKT